MNTIFESHKQVHRFPMTRLEYNEYRGWELPANEDGADEGYLVEYLDGGKPNDERHAGYISWSPKEQFDNGYTEVELQDKVDFMHVKAKVDALSFKFSIVPDTTTTACWAITTLANGNQFQVGYGESACVDPNNFDIDLGEKYAKERCIIDATNNIWKLEGYTLAVTGKTSDKF